MYNFGKEFQIKHFICDSGYIWLSEDMNILMKLMIINILFYLSSFFSLADYHSRGGVRYEMKNHYLFLI